MSTRLKIIKVKVDEKTRAASHDGSRDAMPRAAHAAPRPAGHYVRRRIRQAAQSKAFALVAIIVAIVTTAALVQPAITLTYDCGLDQHTHGDACYTQVLTCGQDNAEGHTHSDACYTRELTCTLPEHVHTEDCVGSMDQGQDGQGENQNQSQDQDSAGEASSSNVDDDRLNMAANTSAANGNADISLAAIDPSNLDGKTFAIYERVGVSNGRVMLDTANTNSSGLDSAQGTEETPGTIIVPRNVKPVIWMFEKVWGKESSYRIKDVNDGFYVAITSSRGNPSGLSRQRTNGTVFTVTSGADDSSVNIYYEYSYWWQTTNYYIGLTGSNENSYFTISRSAHNLVLLDQTSVDNETAKVLAGETPAGTIINLFDYGIMQPAGIGVNEGQPNTEGYLDSGINKDHVMKFSAYSPGNPNTINWWTKTDGGVLQSLVGDRLGADGYPALSGEKQDDGNQSKESLGYLFDPSNKLAGEYRKDYTNVGGLLLVDKDGYYSYDSKQNFAEYREDTNSFTLYDDWGVQYGSDQGMFFPFNSFDKVDRTTSADSGSLNHFFGMTLTTRFMQRFGGHTTANKTQETTFEFSGDDDVWIFINGYLVADLGGIHDAAGVKINFADGTISYDQVYNNQNDKYDSGNAGITKKVDFKDALPSAMLDGKTLKDNQYYTLSFFYLERGGNASNMKIKYNLKSVPDTSIDKVDQYGQPVAGSKFAVYAADENYQYLDTLSGKVVSLPDSYSFDENGNILSSNGIIVNALYASEATASGKLVFTDPMGGAYTLEELKSMFGEHFILREYKVPDGYRVTSDEIHLSINNSNLLLCENQYETGAYAAANLIATATDQIWIDDRDERYDESFSDRNGSYKKLTYYDPTNKSANGTLFAVVMKYEPTEGDTTGIEKESSWLPVYGNAASGYTTVKGAEKLIARSIEAAKEAKKVGQVEFELSPSGSMEAALTNLPGEITSYYYNLPDDQKDKTKFSIGYYWTSAPSVDEATVDNTWLVAADPNTELNYDGFGRLFGSNISVPNVYNRLLVQKKAEPNDDGNGEPVNGATFALYSVNEEDNKNGSVGTVKYVYNNGNGEGLVQLNDNGSASVEDDPTGSYTYKVLETGGIEIYKDGSTTSSYTVLPAKNASGVPLVEATGKETEGTTEEGMASFDGLVPGKYILREVSAPEGYKVNPAETLVLVTKDAVYACAGTSDDGVRVGRGPGYIVDSMREFATDGDINTTLKWIVTMLRVHKEDAGDYSFNDFYESPSAWPFLRDESGNTVTVSGDVSEEEQHRKAMELAMRAYLKYDATLDQDPHHSYSVCNEDEYNAHAVENYGTGIAVMSKRLYTDVGWNYFEIYQDYTFGKSQAGSNVEYTDLFNTAGNPDISLLFSRSVTVEVTDQKVSDLKVSKTIEDAAGVAEDAEFEFEISLTDASDNSLAGIYSWQVYSTADNNPVADASGAGIVENGSAAVALKNGQYVLIKGLPYSAKYKVEEIGATDFTTSFVVDGGTSQPGKSTGDARALKWDADAGGFTTVVAFTNAMPQPVTLVLQKTDAGGQVSLAGAQFVLYRETENGVTNQVEYYNPSASSDANRWAAATADQESVYKFEASANGGFTLSPLPNNATYFLKELKAPDGYMLLDEVIQIDIKDNVVTMTKGGIPFGDSPTDPNDPLKSTLTIPNFTGEELPSAGGSGADPYTFAGALAIACAAAFGWHIHRARERRSEF